MAILMWEMILSVVCLMLGLGVGIFLGQYLSKTRIALLESENRQGEQKARELQTQTQQLQSQMQHQFENLANKIFEKNSNQFRENSERTLATVLGPLRDRLQEFQKRVEDTYSNESRERFALKTEIERIVKANEKMTLEANNLTRALKGDVKAQGNWGEFVLTQILETSGLRKGIEYIVQGEGLGLKSDDGRDQRPDIIVNLPQGKHLIVDSKVSLTHYERFTSEANEQLRAQWEKLFIDSIYAHIDGLSKKNYQNLNGLTTPDFVMMFVPIEGAFSFALQKDHGLFQYAWDKTIVLVSPTTLLTSLRTVAEIWKQEHRNKNAEEIARQAGLLYDKLVGFVGDMQTIEDKLKGAHEAYDRAFSKLKSGRGSVFSKAQTVMKLGAKVSKALPTDLIDEEDEIAPTTEELKGPAQASQTSMFLE